MTTFIIFRRVLNFQKFKNQVSQCSRSSHDAQMFEFHSLFLHGTYQFTQGHTCNFSTNFGAPEHVLAVQILMMHIYCPETQLMFKTRGGQCEAYTKTCSNSAKNYTYENRV